MNVKVFGLLIASFFQFSCLANKALKAFPAASKDQQRFVIQLDHKERSEDKNFKVELFVGKKNRTDGVNQYRLHATLKKQLLKGWGFHYYTVTGNGAISSTRMAAPDNSKSTEELVLGQSLLIAYNSRIPIVIYAPKNYEIRYKVWSCPIVSTPAPIN